VTAFPPPVEGLVDEYLARRIDRREFFKRAGAAGVATTAAAALLASARTAAAAPATTPRRGGVLHEGYDRDVSRPDPVNTPWWDPTLYPALHETLIATDAHNRFVPMLAQSWRATSGGKVWTFTLRSGLRFQSGAPCDAKAVVAAMDSFRDPKQGVNAGFWAPVKSVRAIGSHTVVVQMKHAYADFPFVLNNGYSAIFNKATRDKLGDKYGVTGSDGTGPFKLKSFVPGSHAEVERWGGYPGSRVPFVQNKGKPYLDGIRWEVLLEPATRAKEIEAGNIDTLRGPAPQDVDRLKKNSNLAVILHQEPSLYLFGLNFKHTELGFDDVRVRQAVSHAIDRQAIAKAVFFGKAVPSYTLVPSAWPYYEPSVKRFGAFDPDRSMALLDAAGWKASGGGIRSKNGKKLSFKIIVEADKTEQQIAQAVQQMLQKVGIDLSFTALGADYFTKLVAGPVGYMFKNLWTNMFDASLLFSDSKYFVPACCNASFAKVPALDSAFNAWQSAATATQLKAAAKRAQLVFAEQLPFIPLVTPLVAWVHTKKVHGWLPYESNLYPFYNDVWLES
jgi:ABC-type transport system substrate-binding protein